MAFPTSVNNQITDAVSQVNTIALGDASAIATGNLLIATSQALANAAHNATANQQLAVTSQQATTTMGITNMFSAGAESAGDAVGGIYGKL